MAKYDILHGPDGQYEAVKIGIDFNIWGSNARLFWENSIDYKSKLHKYGMVMAFFIIIYYSLEFIEVHSYVHMLITFLMFVSCVMFLKLMFWPVLKAGEWKKQYLLKHGWKTSEGRVKARTPEEAIAKHRGS